MKSLVNLQELTLKKTLVTGAGLKENLQGHQNLLYLSLQDCPIVDSDIIHLKQLTGLRSIKLVNTNVTEAGVAELRDGLPNAYIHFSNQ